MQDMVNVYFMGKKYSVPANLTIMTAMEYAGYQLIRGCGCRNGFCGACATIYRIKGVSELKVALACETQVQNDMYIATLPFFPLVKQVYESLFNHQVKRDIEAMVKQAKDKAHLSIAAQVLETVKKEFSK